MTRRRQVWVVGTAVLLMAVTFTYVLARTRDGVPEPASPAPSTHRAESKEGVAVPGGEGDTVATDYSTHRVIRRDSAGNLLWATRLEKEFRLHRDPHLLADETRAYVSHPFGVTALDARTGAVVWHSPGPADRMLLTGGLLIAGECSIGERVAKSGRWVTARDTKSGKEVFRVALPLKDFDPLPIQDAAGLILVQKNERPSGAGLALLLDHAGKVRHRFDREVVAARVSTGGDRLILTSRDVVRLSDAGDVRWSAPFEQREWLAGGGLVPVPGGVVAFLYGVINDSGVQVVRLDPNTGKQVWEARCAALGVTHSKYHHTARVELVEDRLRVTSEGSGGTFVEVLDLRTGRQLSRERRKP